MTKVDRVGSMLERKTPPVGKINTDFTKGAKGSSCCLSLFEIKKSGVRGQTVGFALFFSPFLQHLLSFVLLGTISSS